MPALLLLLLPLFTVDMKKTINIRPLLRLCVCVCVLVWVCKRIMYFYFFFSLPTPSYRRHSFVFVCALSECSPVHCCMPSLFYAHLHNIIILYTNMEYVWKAHYLRLETHTRIRKIYTAIHMIKISVRYLENGQEHKRWQKIKEKEKTAFSWEEDLFLRTQKIDISCMDIIFHCHRFVYFVVVAFYISSLLSFLRFSSALISFISSCCF